MSVKSSIGAVMLTESNPSLNFLFSGKSFFRFKLEHADIKIASAINIIVFIDPRSCGVNYYLRGESDEDWRTKNRVERRRVMRLLVRKCNQPKIQVPAF